MNIKLEIFLDENKLRSALAHQSRNNPSYIFICPEGRRPQNGEHAILNGRVKPDAGRRGCGAELLVSREKSDKI